MPEISATVDRYMTSQVHTIWQEDSIAHAHRILDDLQISCLGVVDDADRLAGVVSRIDLLHSGAQTADSRHSPALLEMPTAPVESIMTRGAISVAPTATVTDAARLMLKHRIHRVFVIENENLVGVLSTRDIMDAVIDARIETPISALMSTPVMTVDVAAQLRDAAELFDQTHITGVVVVEHDWPVGIITQTELLHVGSEFGDAPVEDVMSPATICMPAPTLLHRAASQANTMRVRRIIVSDQREMVGILSGLDFARAIA